MSETDVERIVRPDRSGPVEGEEVIGVDRPPEARPGVPMDAAPSEVEAVRERPLVLQEGRREEQLHRPALDDPTPVFGSGQVGRGVSRVLRSAAYEIPGHRKRHWMLLMAADRIDVAEDRLGDALARPLEAAGAYPLALRVRSRPLLALGMFVAGGWLVRRLTR